MNTNANRANTLHEFCEEFKKTTNCSDLEVDKFIEFLENGHQFFSRKESLEIPI